MAIGKVEEKGVWQGSLPLRKVIPFIPFIMRAFHAPCLIITSRYPNRVEWEAWLWPDLRYYVFEAHDIVYEDAFVLYSR